MVCIFSFLAFFDMNFFIVHSMGRVPYKSVPIREVHRRVSDGLRLQRPVNCPVRLWNEVKGCFRDKRKERPTFSELAKVFGQYVRVANKSTSKRPRDVALLVTTGKTSRPSVDERSSADSGVHAI